MAVSHIVGNLSELVARFVYALSSISLKLQAVLVPTLDVYHLAVKRSVYNTASASVGGVGYVYFYNAGRTAMKLIGIRAWTNSGTFTFTIMQIAGRDLYTMIRPVSFAASYDTNGSSSLANIFKAFCDGFVLEPGWSIGFYVNAWTGADTLRLELLVEEWDT